MSFPITANLDESLKVEIHLHQFYLGDRDRYCWTYITRGMERHQQHEMCLSLLVDDDGNTENFPKTPVKMFQLLAERTKSGRSVGFGDSTRLGNRGIFDFPCVFYVPSIQYDGLPSVDDHLALILVHQEEHDYVRQYGLTRFLSRLGKYCSSFPYPTWNTPARPSLFPASTRELSILSDASHILADHSCVHQLETVLQLQLHQQDAGAVLKHLESLQPGQVGIINTAFSPRCDASLYWQEGQETPGAYAAPEATTGLLGGSFISLGFNETAELSIEEDGFSATLAETDWRNLCKAIQEAESFEIGFPNGQRFVLDYVDISAKPRARPYDPVAVWQNLEPTPLAAESAEDQTRNVKSGKFDILSGAASFHERVNQDELINYIQQIEGTLDNVLSEETESFLLELEFRITPNQLDIDLLSDIELNPEFERFIIATVQSIEPCKVNDPIGIRVPFYVNPRN